MSYTTYYLAQILERNGEREYTHAVKFSIHKNNEVYLGATPESILNAACKTWLGEGEASNGGYYFEGGAYFIEAGEYQEISESTYNELRLVGEI